MKLGKKVLVILFVLVGVAICRHAHAQTAVDAVTAVYTNDMATLQKLLDEGLDPNLKGDENYQASLLNTACDKNSPEMVELLLSKGADVNLAGAGGYTPLMWAAGSGKTPEIVTLLLEKGADIHAIAADGISVLNKAVFGIVSGYGSMETLKLLVDKGLDVNYTYDKGETAGYTGLMVAARWNHIELAEYLLSKGADVNAQAKNGDTPLSIATAEKYGGMADLLKKHGAKK